MTVRKYVFADDDMRIRREITVEAETEKNAHLESWNMLTEEEKNVCGCWTCIDELPAQPQQPLLAGAIQRKK